MSKLSKLRVLSAQEWRYLTMALLFLPTLRLALRGWSFRRVYTLLLRTAPIQANQSVAATDFEISPLVRMVNVAADHGFVKATCLPRSLAIWWWLRRQGVESEIRIGVNQQADEFQAHAWVERDGVVINDRDDVHQRFAAFDRLAADMAQRWV